jgi:hypothetical protein
MKARQRIFPVIAVMLVGCFVLLIIGYIQRNPQWPGPLSSILGSPPATPVTAISRERAVQRAFEEAAQGLHLWEVITPTLVSADLMHYEDAKKRSNQNSFGNDIYPPDLDVWFVVLTGTWQLIPPDPEHKFSLPRPMAGEM